MIDLIFRRQLITFGLTVNTERHLRGVRVRTDSSKLLKIQSDEVFGTDRNKCSEDYLFSLSSIYGSPELLVQTRFFAIHS